MVRCTPDGVYLDIPEIKEAETLEMLSRSVGPVVYWWRVCEGNVREITEQNLAELKTIPDLALWMESHHENMAKWVEPLHCTAYYDASGKDKKYEN